MTSPVTQTFRAAFDFALDEFIRTLKEAQDYLGGVKGSPHETEKIVR